MFGLVDGDDLAGRSDAVEGGDGEVADAGAEVDEGVALTNSDLVEELLGGEDSAAE